MNNRKHVQRFTLLELIKASNNLKKTENKTATFLSLKQRTASQNSNNIKLKRFLSIFVFLSTLMPAFIVTSKAS